MPIKLEEFEGMLGKYPDVLKKLKIRLYGKMKGYAYSEKEFRDLVEECMTPLMDVYWPKEHNGCGYMSKSCNFHDEFVRIFNGTKEHVIKKDLSDTVERVETPSELAYYKLTENALGNIFGIDITELYQQSTEYFKMYFEILDEKERKELIKSLFSLEKRNDEVDKWLSERYSTIVKQIGMDSVGETYAD